MSIRVETQHVRKYFGDVHANDDISLIFETGRIYGLLGENGAGKSTLMKILSGYQKADGGKILLDDKPSHFDSPADALQAGIGMLYQEPLDLPPFTVLENYLLGQHGGMSLGAKQAAEKLEALGKRYGFEIEAENYIRNLSLGERQQLELLRLLAGGAQVLILDEPTTGISAEQKTVLFDSMRKLARDEGKTLILVSHKLDEVQELCDHAYVLRKGQFVGESKVPCPNATLVGMMFEQLPPRRPRAELAQKATALEFNDLVVKTPRLDLQPVNLKVQAGEVFGLAGLEGSGQELLLKACGGLVPRAGGRMRLDGEEINRLDYHAARKRGIAYVAAGRIEEGLVSGLSLTEHMALVDEHPRFLIDWNGSSALAGERIERYRVVGQPQSAVEELSGGNQQRFLFALLPVSLKLILMEHPTRGLDLRSTDWIWQSLDDRRKEGTAILFISADLDEIVGRSDRIAVFSGGRMSRIVDAAHTSAEELGHLIGGQQ
jgi:simple sugar transport system ATP-binding protein